MKDNIPEIIHNLGPIVFALGLFLMLGSFSYFDDQRKIEETKAISACIDKGINPAECAQAIKGRVK